MKFEWDSIPDGAGTGNFYSTDEMIERLQSTLRQIPNMLGEGLAKFLDDPTVRKKIAQELPSARSLREIIQLLCGLPGFASLFEQIVDAVNESRKKESRGRRQVSKGLRDEE